MDATSKCKVLSLVLLAGVLYAPWAAAVCSEECDRSQCEDPADLEGSRCPAGITMDECDCCYVCANEEHQLCEHPQLTRRRSRYLGSCGDNMECVMRDDLPEGTEEAVCKCLENEMICGSDDVTYANVCEMMLASKKKGVEIQIQTEDPCPTAPQIVGTPQNIKDDQGSNMAIVCEAIGFPIPVIEWVWKRVDGKTGFLPSDDRRISAYTRGGPEKMQVTGWLQIQDIQKEHEGDYTCIAQNTQGMDQSTARLNVEDEDLRNY